MNTYLIFAAGAMLAGAALGYFICGVAARRYRRLYKKLKSGAGGGIMDKVLVFEAAVLILYTVADLAVFWHTGAEPSVLTSCVFGVCGLENGVMGWIKTNKDRQRGGTENNDLR